MTTRITLDHKALRSLIDEDSEVFVELKSVASTIVADQLHRALTTERIQAGVERATLSAIGHVSRNHASLTEAMKTILSQTATKAVEGALERLIQDKVREGVEAKIEGYVEAIASRMINDQLATRVDRHIQARISAAFGTR